MKIEDLIALLSHPKLNARKDHYISDCPFCKKSKHFYLNRHKILNKKNGKYFNSWDCKKCGENGNLTYLLKHLNALYLIDGEHLSLLKVPMLMGFGKDEEENTSLFVPEVKMPIGFKRNFNDEYLISRGFTDEDFQKYIVGRTDLLFKLKDYIVIAVVEGGKIRAYLTRITWSKKKIKKYEKETGKKVIRYRNSSHDFSKMLLGYDEIRFNTEWVVLVEGYFDKTSVDKHLELDSNAEMKCCCTFGKSISINQIRKLKQKGVKNIILIQDPDAIKDTKKSCYRLDKEFENVLVGVPLNNKDLGDSNKREILKIFNNLKKPFNFSIETIEGFK